MSSVGEIYFTETDFNFCTKYRGLMNLNRAFALRLSNLLAEKGMSKYKLEKETGLTHSALRYIFNEVNSDVKFSTIVKVCNALNITIKEFFDDDLFNLANLDFE